MKYLIRTKEPINNKILYGIELPDTDEFDVRIPLNLTHSKKVIKKSDCQNMLYIPKRPRTKLIGIEETHFLELRIVKIKLKHNLYEYLVTNLSEDEFDSDALKELYRMRWGIESSYKELKFAAGLINFHSRKKEFIIQEIWARLILYNYSEAIAMRITVERLDNKKQTSKYKYQLNYTTALYMCRLYLKIMPLITAVQLESIVEMNILPIREGRITVRPNRPRKPTCFCYRLS